MHFSAALLGWMPYLSTGIVCWFIFEAAVWKFWRWRLRGDSSHTAMQLHRIVIYTVRGFHALVVVCLCLRVFAQTGLGMDGTYEENACLVIPAADHAIVFSLTWGFWEVVSLLRDIDKDLPLMIVHSFIMIVSLSSVLLNGVFKQMMCVCLFMETSTIFLNPRLMILEWYGKEGKSFAIFHFVQVSFGATFFVVRDLFFIPRMIVNISVLGKHAGIDDYEWEPCTGRWLVAIDIVLLSLQALLHIVWTFQIAQATIRAYIKKD